MINLSGRAYAPSESVPIGLESNEVDSLAKKKKKKKKKNRRKVM